MTTDQERADAIARGWFAAAPGPEPTPSDLREVIAAALTAVRFEERAAVVAYIRGNYREASLLAVRVERGEHARPTA